MATASKGKTLTDAKLISRPIHCYTTREIRLRKRPSNDEGIVEMSGQGLASQVWRSEHLRLAIDAARVA